MARRKKRTPTPQRDIVAEYDGWKTGDHCYTVFPGETKPAYCEVIEFHPMDDVTPSVSVTEITTGKYRVAAMMAIADTSKGAKKLAPKINKFLTEWKAEQALLEKKRRIALAKAEKARLAKEEEEDRLARIAAEEEETKKLKKKKKSA